MSTRPHAGPIYVIPNGDMSGDITSLVSIIPMLSMISYGVSWAGTAPVGTLTVQVSNDYSLNPDSSVNNAGTWNDVPFTIDGVLVLSIPISGGTGNGFIDIDQIAGYAIRCVYTASSGTGFINIVANGKVS